MKYRDWNEMQRKLEALYVLDNALTDPSEEYLRLFERQKTGKSFIIVWITEPVIPYP